MPYVHLTLPVKQKLNQFKMFLEKNEYRKSTITSYNTYVSRFLRSSYYDEIKPDFKQQITEFLENDVFGNIKVPRMAV